MIAVIQRVLNASVTADGEPSGKVEKGLLVLLGVKAGDTEDVCLKMADKLTRMRIFEDANGKTNLSVGEVGGGILLVSNFTLCASCRKGNPEVGLVIYKRRPQWGN